MVGWPLDLWQKWLAISLGELFQNGERRYLKAIILVGRQNGKTVFTRLLILYWMYIERVEEILGTSTDRAAAFRSWKKTIVMAEKSTILADALPAKHTTGTTGLETFWNDYGSQYRFSAPNSNAGRGDTLDRVLLDELRQHKNRDVWDATVPATAAVNGLAVCISNEGDMDSIVLHEEYDAALESIETEDTDTDTFLAAWSSPPKAEPTDLEALAYANPSLNRIRPNGSGITSRALLGEAKKAARLGGDTLLRFRIERMCQRIDLLDPAIDMEAWAANGVDKEDAIDLALHRDKLALCFDVSLDATHVALIAAATIDGLTHGEVVDRWKGRDCTKQFRADLPGLVDKLKPRKLVWFPGGPAAAVAASLAERRGAARWPPRRVELEELKPGVVPSVCMGLAEQVLSGEVQHPRDPMLTEHVRQTKRLERGDVWVFERRNKEEEKSSPPINGTYALAGAVHAARTLPKRTPLIAL